MKSAITNNGINFIINNTTGGAWFSITHFSLAWVNETERTNNPATATATKLVSDPDVNGKTNGDYIFNIWQTPFAWDGTGRKYGVGESLPEGFGAYFKYELDNCNDTNTLEAYADSGATPGYGITTGKYVGATESTPGALSIENIPAPLYYSTANAIKFGTKKYSKYFPIKSYYPVNTLGEGDEAKVGIMNYTIELPSVTTKINDEIESIKQSIGNFKFNRIGLYVTKSTYPDNMGDRLITSLVPVADEEPVLFAIIDLTRSNSCGTSTVDTTLNIVKARDDSGLNAFTYEAQIDLTPVSSADNFASLASMYVDTARDDATNFYLSQIEANANLVESILQLQLQYLQIKGYLGKTAQQLMSEKKKGINSILMLGHNKEYFIDSISKPVFYYKGDLFRAYEDNGSINRSNAIINISNSISGIEDGDSLTIIIDNLDGSVYDFGGIKYPKWSGNIMITNYSDTKEKIAVINYENIAGLSNAKVTVDLIYSYVNSCWIVERVTTLEEKYILA